MMVNEIIGATLTNELFRKGVTPAALASSVGISQFEIENLCNGTYVDTFTITIISQALGVNLLKSISDIIDSELKI